MQSTCLMRRELFFQQVTCSDYISPGALALYTMRTLSVPSSPYACSSTSTSLALSSFPSSLPPHLSVSPSLPYPATPPSLPLPLPQVLSTTPVWLVPQLPSSPYRTLELICSLHPPSSPCRESSSILSHLYVLTPSQVFSS